MYELKQNESGTWICHDTRPNGEFPRPATPAEIQFWLEWGPVKTGPAPAVRTVAPVIGEIVHYTHGGNPFAAIVVNSNDDGTINLTWFKSLGGHICGSNRVDFEANGAEGTWRWPPERTI